MHKISIVQTLYGKQTPSCTTSLALFSHSCSSYKSKIVSFVSNISLGVSCDGRWLLKSLCIFMFWFRNIFLSFSEMTALLIYDCGVAPSMLLHAFCSKMFLGFLMLLVYIACAEIRRLSFVVRISKNSLMPFFDILALINKNIFA